MSIKTNRGDFFVAIYYGAVFLALLGLAVWNLCNKQYQTVAGTELRSSCRFNALNGLTIGVLFWIIGCITHGGLHFAFSPYSVLIAALYAVFCGGYTVLGMKLMGEGKLSLYIMFLMLGGMLLPYLYGIVFLRETITVGKIVGCVLLTGGLILFSLGEKKDGDKPVTAKFLLLCFAVFVLNGGVSILSKIHQTAPAVRHPVDTAEFVMLSNLVKGLIFCAVTPFTPKEAAAATQKQKKQGILYTLLSAVLGGFASFCLLFAAGKVDASIQYPVVSGGTVVLSAITGWLFYHETLSKRSTVLLILIFAATFLFLF